MSEGTQHSDIHCVHNTVASNARCRTTFIAGPCGTVAVRLATAACLKQPAAIDN